jgi:hypothetical protein
MLMINYSWMRTGEGSVRTNTWPGILKTLRSSPPFTNLPKSRSSLPNLVLPPAEQNGTSLKVLKFFQSHKEMLFSLCASFLLSSKGHERSVPRLGKSLAILHRHVAELMSDSISKRGEVGRDGHPDSSMTRLGTSCSTCHVALAEQGEEGEGEDRDREKEGES